MSITWTILVLLGMAHFLLAILATKDVANWPLFNLKQKVIWQLILWLLPILGALLVHKKLEIGWGGGAGTGGEGAHCGYRGDRVDGGYGGSD